MARQRVSRSNLRLHLRAHGRHRAPRNSEAWSVSSPQYVRICLRTVCAAQVTSVWPYLYPEYLEEVNSPGLDSAQCDAESQCILTKPDAWGLLPQCVRRHVAGFRLLVARQPDAQNQQFCRWSVE